MRIQTKKKRKIKNIKKRKRIMAEIIENGNHGMHKDIPSMGKANAALTTGKQ